MKTRTIVLLMQAAAFCAIGAERSQAVAPAPEEMAEARQWAAAKFEGDEPFFSFTYDGRPSAELLKTWKSEKAREQFDDQRTQHVLTYTDPETGLVVRCVGIEYAGFPTVEWTLYFENTGAGDTPILADFRALDIRLTLSAATAAGQELPLTETHRQLLEAAEAAGFGDADNSAIIRAFERQES